MKFFLLKRPTNLELIREEFRREVPVPRVSQVRLMGGRSNSRLVKCSNGEWYIRTGNDMARLVSTHAKEMGIAVVDAAGGVFVGRVGAKYFVEKK